MWHRLRLAPRLGLLMLVGAGGILATVVAAAEYVSERMLQIARSIQVSLVPQSFPSRNGLDIAALLEPAREVGGDFYDAFPITGDRLCVAIGDVSGKGVPAALFMAVTCTLLRALVRQGYSPAAALSRLDRELSEENDSCMFVTVFLAVMDLETGDLVYASGGHNPPRMLLGQGSLCILDEARGHLLGAMPGPEILEGHTRLEAGSTLVIYTDGVTEAMDPSGALLGEERFDAMLTGLGEQPATETVAAIRRQVASWAAGAPQSDDVTVLAVRRCRADGSGTSPFKQGG